MSRSTHVVCVALRLVNRLIDPSSWRKRSGLQRKTHIGYSAFAEVTHKSCVFVICVVVLSCSCQQYVSIVAKTVWCRRSVMGAITSKGRSKKAVSKDENNKDERNRIPSLIVTQAGSEPPDEALEVDPVGGGAKDMTVNEELRRVIEDGRREIKEAQEKLNSSLTTPIVESEAKVRNCYVTKNHKSLFVSFLHTSIFDAI